MDIIRNLMTIEWLKEILVTIAEVYQLLSRGRLYKGRFGGFNIQYNTTILFIE